MTIPELDDPSSLLFLSCDLTGSTDFKQQQAKDEKKTPWQKVFLQFYRDFPQQIASTQRDENTEHLNFQLWKPIGDELIYSCEVKSEDDVYRAVRTWIRAMDAYRLSSLEEETTMGTKGGAFIATFPGPDSKASIPRDPSSEVSDLDPWELNRNAYLPTEDGVKDHSGYLYDFFGPSIDTGFRVVSMCKPRYFTLSVEVALAMIGRSKVLCKTEDEYHVEDLVLLDFVELKGVWGGRQYPVIAIDLEYGDPVQQAYARIHGRGSREDLLNLCRACYTTEEWPFALYLPDSTDDHFHKTPVDKLRNVKTTRPEGVERRAEEAEDEPENADELRDDVPLGESAWRLGVTDLRIPETLSSDEATALIDEMLRSQLEGDLLPDERIARWDVLSVEQGGGQIGLTVRYSTLRAKPTESTAPINLPGYQPHPFDQVGDISDT